MSSEKNTQILKKKLPYQLYLKTSLVEKKIKRIERIIAKYLNNDEVFYDFQATTNVREIE